MVSPGACYALRDRVRSARAYEALSTRTRTIFTCPALTSSNSNLRVARIEKNGVQPISLESHVTVVKL